MYSCSPATKNTKITPLTNEINSSQPKKGVITT